MKRMTRSGFLFACAATASLVATSAAADVTAVWVDSSVALGTFAERPYLEIKGSLIGTVARSDKTIGTYRVPFTVDYPADAGDCNGFAVVEPLHQSRARHALLTMGADHLFGQGYVYVSVAWDKTDANSKGGIGRLSDGWQIVRDAASLVRAPGGAYQNLAAPAPCGVQTALAFGLSRTAILLRGLVGSGRNHDQVFDGLLITEAGSFGLNLDGPERATVSYPSPLPEDGKILAVNTEHDVARFQGWRARGDGPSYRAYEIAGAPHVWKSLNDFSILGATRQNPLSAGPVYKAMLTHLRDWLVDGEEPPPGVTLPGSVVAPPANDMVPRLGCGRLSPCPIFEVVRDERGNATGGLRLPPIAAPIGTYHGVETQLAGVFFPLRQTVSFGGTFAAFDAATLSALYRNHGAYVSQVARAADEAREAGWILDEDAEAYVTAAAQGTVGKPAAGGAKQDSDWREDEED